MNDPEYDSRWIGAVAAMTVAVAVLAIPENALAQQVAASSEGRGSIFGPFAGMVGVMLLVWRTVWVINRSRQSREEKEEQQWYSEAASVQNRPSWMTTNTDTARTARPDWMSPRDAAPQARPLILSTDDDRPDTR